jgi:putative hydrolase of the HAD superfamily
MPIELICLDADDTLWHNMRHFNATEHALFAMLKPFADIDVSREALIACEARNLPLYGYGVKGFTLSMIETAVELAGDRLTTSLIADILAAGRELLGHPVELLDGVDDTLTELADLGRLILVTKGDLLHQETKLAASGLGERFSGIEIVSDKSAETFTRLFERYGVQPEQAVMAGDSLRSDVKPALEAGAWAAYIPQEGAWSHEAAQSPDTNPRYRQFAALGELPEWIRSVS